MAVSNYDSWMLSKFDSKGKTTIYFTRLRYDARAQMIFSVFYNEN